jgi:hypothetical protein
MIFGSTRIFMIAFLISSSEAGDREADFRNLHLVDRKIYFVFGELYGEKFSKNKMSQNLRVAALVGFSFRPQEF